MKAYFSSGKTTRHPLVMSEFMTCPYEKWWLAYVFSADERSYEINMFA
jgi:hypothetical protein